MIEPVKRYIMYTGTGEEKAMPGCGTEVVLATDYERMRAEDAREIESTADIIRTGGLRIASLQSDLAACTRAMAEKDAEIAEWKAIAEQWASDAESSRQPDKFYEGYSEGAMNAMQALLTRSEASLASLKARCEGMRAALEEIGHPHEDNCPVCRQIFDTHSEECLIAQAIALASPPVEGKKSIACPEWPELVGPRMSHGPERQPEPFRYEAHDTPIEPTLGTIPRPVEQSETEQPPAKLYRCLGCGRMGQFASYELANDLLSGATQHWREKAQEWCGPVEKDV